MKNEYLSARLNKKIFWYRRSNIFKKRIFLTFQNLIKTFYNIEIKSFNKILDLGAGDKNFTKVVKENGIDCIGITNLFG